MFKDVSEYLEELKRELKGSDPALVQDALSDAEGHLRMALEEALSATSGLSEAEAIVHIIEKYGNPQEIASAYRAIESRTSPSLAVLRSWTIRVTRNVTATTTAIVITRNKNWFRVSDIVVNK